MDPAPGTGVSTSTLSLTLDGISVIDRAIVDAAGADVRVPGLTPGAHSIYGQVSDLSGNVGSVSIPFTVESIPPVLTVLGVTDGSTLHDPNVAMQILYSDPAPSSGIATSTLQILVDGSSVTDRVRIGPSGASVSGLGLSTGPHTVTGQVADQVGNVGRVSVSFTLVTTAEAPPPALSLIGISKDYFSPAYNAYHRQHQDFVTLRYRVSEPVAPQLQVWTSTGTRVLTTSLPMTIPGTTAEAVWDGRAADGSLVDSGSYLVQLTGTSAIGATTSSASATVRLHY